MIEIESHVWKTVASYNVETLLDRSICTEKLLLLYDSLTTIKLDLEDYFKE